MLSRVAAAVKAPRTHNRRRVTGSSGRRREGRESEPQRPNMSRHHFYSAVLLLFVVMMCFGSGAASAGGRNPRNTIDPFKGTASIPLANWRGFKEAGSKITSLRVPGLVKVGDDVFAVAEAQCGEESGAGSCAGIVSKHLDISDDSMDISMSDISLFCMQLVDTAANNFGTTEVLRPTTLVIGDSVYMLLGNQSRKKPQDEVKNERGLLLVKGTVTVDGGNTKKLLWNEAHVVKPEPKGDSLSLTELIGGGGSGAVMRDGTLVFPIQAKNKDGTSVLLSMSFDPSKKKWEFSSEATGNGCRDPSIVEWGENEGDERPFMMAHCAGGYYDVYRSTPEGVSWYNLGEPINRVWGNSRGRTGDGVKSGFTTATIEGKEVMLITAPVYAAKENGSEEGRLHLWVTDNARVYDVGPISRGGDDAAASSLLVKSKDELILLYEKRNDDGPYSLVAMRLTEQLERIKSAVKTWKELDNALKVPTEGLVGVLSGTLDGTAWKDEYLGVNATVRGGVTSTESGVTLRGAEAQWPVGDMGQTVPYYFTNNKFTLSATVTIHEVPKEGSSPLIGARLNDQDGTVLFQLSYTSEGNWNLTLHKKDFLVKPSGDVGNWEKNTAIRVTVQKNNDDEWFVYANGRRIYETDEEELEEEEMAQHRNADQFGSHRISHFFFGAGNKEDEESSPVTVADVLLYNRILYGDDFRSLNARTVPIRHPAAEELDTAVKFTATEEEKQKVRQLDVAQLGAATREATTQEDTQPAATLQTATQLTTSLADVEEAPIAQPTEPQSVRVLAGSQSSAENVMEELRLHTAAKNDSSVPGTNHSVSDGSMGPEDRLALITDAKLILHDLRGDSTAFACVSRALLLLLGLCALVAVL
ncbi:putative trans-sialidase, Group VII [Trypanosoma cruzi]|uniref:Trans-sialidase, putative n=2 Tax=Trypanosoma cruzi TaxID=5693 RepID=Q4DDZ1_TRYCC|nr:trans-sialidase, putative [Trypanosoma cruzi]EAN90742.1 trans-sialidase, putative [Trypanosoma cruzi]PWV03622.1 putative trans-sialidase, Group VII [Trypanosoma cruzi]RNC34690.1 sialidase-like protein [Trypanosoma cruzi]|eukprot:XP_812593.1 trans-sialidase [Trypanosoma cruzi strain CL Brener]